MLMLDDFENRSMESTFEICRSELVSGDEDLMLDKSEDEEIVEIENSLDNLVGLLNNNLNEASISINPTLTEECVNSTLLNSSSSDLESLGYEVPSTGSEISDDSSECIEDKSQIGKTSFEKLRVLYTNADTYLNKKEELNLRISQENPDIIAMVEILPKNKSSNISECELQIDGYNMFLNNDPKRGCVIHVDKNLVSATNQLEHHFDEVVSCFIHLERGDKLLICCIYRSPNSPKENNARLLELIESACSSNPSHLLMLGDFNFKDIDWDHFKPKLGGSKDTSLFVDKIKSEGLYQHVKEYTRMRTGQEPSLLDLVLTNEEGMINKIDIESPLGKSDHTTLVFDFVCYAERFCSTDKYSYTRGNYKSMREDLINEKWMVIDKNENVAAMWDEFESVMARVTERNVPKFHSRGNLVKHELQPWVNSMVRTVIRNKHYEWNKYQRHPTEENWKTYIIARNRSTKGVRQAKKAHERIIAENLKVNPKGFWKLVQQKTKVKTGITDLISNGTKITSDQGKANILNRFFSSVFTVEDQVTVPKIEIPNDIPEQAHLHITENQVIKVLEKLKTDKSPGPDGIHNKVLHETKNEVVVPLTKIINKSLSEGCIPDRWREAQVIPVFKKGNRSDPNNYRPVSLTSTCCKIMETLVRDSVMAHLLSYNLLANEQHGFCSKRSCCTQLLEAVHDWAEALDTSDPVDVIYLDYRKAFDSVPHSRLYEKLNKYNINGQIKTWIRDFLKDRKQRVVVNGKYSQVEDVTSGVPQGSVLGPLLFLLFVNDLPDDVQSVLKLFADDSKLYRKVRSPLDAEALQRDLNALSDWSHKWQLSFNVEKCKVMHLGKPNRQHTYFMKDGSIETLISSVEVEKDLGIVFDSELKFVEHIEEVCNKGHQRIALIRRTFNYMDGKMFLVLYKSLIRPMLEYCSTVWSTMFKKDSEKLEKVQRKATKLVGSIRDKDYPSRLRHLDLPSLVYRRRRTDLLQVYRYFSGLDQFRGEELFQVDSGRTRGHHRKLIKPRANKIVKQKMLAYRVITDWNSLPEAIVMAESINIFKNKLEKFWSSVPFKFDPTGFY